MAVKYLLKTIETYRLEALVDVKDFHEWLQEDAKRQRYILNGFSWTEKQSKEDEWYNVKVTKIFEKEKDPDLPLKEITYETYAKLDDTQDELDIDELDEEEIEFE